jgi:hypothetical protein
MRHDLAPDILEEIHRQISIEGYSSADEVLRDALAACAGKRMCGLFRRGSPTCMLGDGEP